MKFIYTIILFSLLPLFVHAQVDTVHIESSFIVSEGGVRFVGEMQENVDQGFFLKCHLFKRKVRHMDKIVLISPINLHAYGLSLGYRLIIQEKKIDFINAKDLCGIEYMSAGTIDVVFIKMTKKEYKKRVNHTDWLDKFPDKSDYIKLGVVLY